MNPSVSFPFPLLFVVLLILFLSSFFSSHAYNQDDDRFSRCEPFDCGPKIKGISYPFRKNSQPDYCGYPGFVLDCESDPDTPVLDVKPQKFRVLSINQEDQILTIARMDFWDSYCPKNFTNITLNSTPFRCTPKDKNATFFFDCDYGPHKFSNPFDCAVNNVSRRAYFVPKIDLESLERMWSVCKVSVVVPVMEEVLEGLIGGSRSFDDYVFQGGFEVVWNELMEEDKCRECVKSQGRCGYNSSSSIDQDKFFCFCPPGHQSEERICRPFQEPLPEHHEDPAEGPDDPGKSPSNSLGWRVKVAIGVGLVIVLFLICIMTCCLGWKKSIKCWTKMTENDQDLEAFIRSYGHLAAKRFRYLDVKKMTKSFKEKLGQGGYGEVYKEELHDRRLVAVKILNGTKGNGEEFINEVASISRTSHINIVTLLGFCLEGHKRALIYEFMANGSLEKFTFKDNPSQTTPRLEWEKLLQISIGIARGLEYLHRGCNTKILHLDIKPHNILLDEDFCPKIADFGLAKLCPRKDSIISMADARGTIGYIAPEVFSRNFGGVSSRSDVYSYGMMILEMVGGRKNLKVKVSRTSEIYFPDWIYKHIELGSTLQLWGDMTSEENKIARKMALVGLWCIQTKPSDRPSTSKVVEMLDGSLEALHLPPNPCMFSPTSPEILPAEPSAESSTTSLI